MSPHPIHLRARDLHKGFQIGARRLEILRGVDLEVRRGENLFLVGSSGAGKTTLLYTLAGLERPDSGDVLIDGRPLYAAPARERARIRNREIGFIFQNYCLLPELSALENVWLPARIGGGAANPARALTLLDHVGLADRASHLPSQLSGGEQQRVAIARALANDPPILLADEPTGNLDSHTGREIIDLLLAMARENGKTLVVVTHDATLAARGDRRVEIADGILHARGALHDATPIPQRAGETEERE